MNKQLIVIEKSCIFFFSVIYNININYELCIWYDNDVSFFVIFLKYFIIVLFLEMVFILVNVK